MQEKTIGEVMREPITTPLSRGRLRWLLLATVALITAGSGATAAGSGATAAGSGATAVQAAMPSFTDLAICRHVSALVYPSSPSDSFDCASPVFTPGDVFLAPDSSSCETPVTSDDLGTFSLDDNPFGAFVHVSAQSTCNPPQHGQGAGYGPFTLTVTKTAGPGRGSSTTVPAKLGPIAGILLPIGTLSIGAYRVTATFPTQTLYDPFALRSFDWLGSQATGLLHISAPFRESSRFALLATGATDTFAALISNSLAGPGAGEILWTKTGNRFKATFRTTDYYGTGTIETKAAISYGKLHANGFFHFTGRGAIVSGTGDYEGLIGHFTVNGSYNTGLKRGSYSLLGSVTY